jgi:transcriptional regulator with XRE-family HTH domain
MNVGAVGEYIRKQRESSSLSLRKVSGLAGVSIPYLSQIERGLRKPSADILQAIAKGLRISAETLYIQAGILEDRPAPDVAAAVMSDPTITEGQKQALLHIYEAFRAETKTQARKRSRAGRGVKPPAPRSPHPGPLRSSTTKPRKEV